ncbi:MULTISPECIES: gas vesicle protein [unclassified Streptomyces]|uniref:gas vesicle protein GvpO n=1 Tax=unclassified Streptomyces TaxID=2593676 RepID=UPI0009989F0F|nr:MULTISPECIES: gas vesicle protein [unclassified Streptomyces]
MSNTSHASNSRDSSEEPDKRKSMTPMEVVRKGSAQFVELTGLEAESVSSFTRTDDGWSLEIEVLELSRVPDTMSLLASYEVELTADGDLAGYRRVRRYERGRADRRSGG